MRKRTSLACALAALAAWVVPAAPASASEVTVEQPQSPDGTVIGKLIFTAPRVNEVNRVTITFAPFNEVTISDSAGIQAAGRCEYPNPASRTTVVCDGKDFVRFDPAFVNLGPRSDRLTVRGIGGVRPTITIESGLGNDVVSGGPGVDSLLDLAGADTLRGNGGNDTIFGQIGNDRVFGGAGNDRVEGGRGNDRVYGGLGNDFLLAGPGDDYILSGPGRDRILAGAGLNFVDGRRRVGP
jgi:hypothetical protein